MRIALASLVVALLCGVAAAERAAPRPRYAFVLQDVSATDKAPAELSVKAKALFAELVAARPDTLASAPGDAHVKSFAVTLKVDTFERSLVPSGKPGDTGQVLTIKVGVSLVGQTIPAGTLALAGSGSSTVVAQVGMRVHKGEEEEAQGEALRDALGHALDEAVARLAAPPPKKHPRKR